MTHSVILDITDRIVNRSVHSRTDFLQKTQKQADIGKSRAALTCGNLAHAVASSCQSEKDKILNLTSSNLAIITAYNDMLSAHQPYKAYPEQIKNALSKLGHTAQVAGGVPAMCDGVTQGQAGMDMSLFSRDLIAQATALSLSHNLFDGTLLLGICDKIAPGQLMGALCFAHLPTTFIPAGPMSTGIGNDEKVEIRQKYAAGNVGKEALLKMECGAYHSPGTCTFYGTANTNQLVFETMGLMLPGSAFVHPNSSLRSALTDYAAARIAAMAHGSSCYRPLSEVVTEKSVVNGVVALLASGGSTNHTIHMVAIARAAGIILTWQDISDLSDIVPLLLKLYPNGPADVNEFERIGGVPALLKRLHENDLLHTDVTPTFGSFEDQLMTPHLVNGKLCWESLGESKNTQVLAAENSYFHKTGGTKMLVGNIGRCVAKVSAIAEEFQVMTAPAKVFHSQHDVEKAYQSGLLNEHCVVVVAYNGPAANGMPELHKLMPILGNVQKAGYKVALVTDGRLSGASGKIPAAIHLSPEALHGGAIGLIRDGDMIKLDCIAGTLDNLSDVTEREALMPDTETHQQTWGRDMFKNIRSIVSSAELGASFIY